jgi:demethylmenaquinone methyltransferase/2-methoxy-6-polyprenyl-1,4-benzoquinol methylase
MFSQIAPRYDLANSVLSLLLHHRWRAQAVAMLELRPGDSAIDICCGTGDFLIPLRRAIGPKGRAFGVDFSLPMLERAAKKKPGEVVVLGDACQLPVCDAAFDGLTIGWGIRNVADIDAAHREIFRVLRPGGRFVSLDMARSRNRTVRAVSDVFLRIAVPWLGSLVGDRGAYRYLAESTRAFWSREQLAASMAAAGMVDVRTRDLMFGNVCIHYGRRPAEGPAK